MTLSKRMKSKTSRAIHRVRIVASSALLGAVVAGTFFGWLPALGMIGAHEVGAALGAGVGVLANAKHLI